MDIALLRTFLAVHRAGSFTRAGTLLGLSQPTVTGQIRALEGQLGRPLFIRQSRGVTPTAIGEELAHKVAPHLDALLEITDGSLDTESEDRTLHICGPPEFTALRAVPALAPLVAQGLSLRVTFTNAVQSIESLSAGHCDLILTTARPRGELLATTPLWDEVLVLVAAPRWAACLGEPTGPGARDDTELRRIPALSVHESQPLLSRYWTDVFGTALNQSSAVVTPDLRSVLATVIAGAGMAVLPRYLCSEALRSGAVVPLRDPPVPPLRTYFLSVRAGALTHQGVARTHERLVRTAHAW